MTFYQKLFVSILIWIVMPMHCFAQDSFHNFGNLKIHESGAMGFHHDFINNGFTDDNLGLAGFYSDNSIRVSGALRPIFNDMEVMVSDDLILEVGIGITNNKNFILGDILTPRNLLDVNIEFISTALYNGEENLVKVDGYSAINNKQDFIFPIGDNNKLRSLELSSETVNQSAKSAYFMENPNTPSTFLGGFDTENRTDILIAVSTYEFWDLDAQLVSTVNLSWDSDSNLANFVDEIDNLRVVGWHTVNGIWEDLGATSVSGDFTSGNITSDSFIPDNYSIITFGTSLSTGFVSLGNFLLTPNGDGVNDFLHIDAVALSPNNQLTIFNRWGRAVYREKDYSNLFEGKANVNFVVSNQNKLPAEVYFYIIELQDVNLTYQGFLLLEY